MGALAGLASLLHTARVGSASPDAGTLNGTRCDRVMRNRRHQLMAAAARSFGAVLGALILSSLDNACRS